MRRTRGLFLSVGVAVSLLATSGCGVIANDTAATVSGRDVSVDDVNELLEEPASVLSLLGLLSSDEESRQPGDAARAALGFELQRVALITAVENWGLSFTPEVDDAAAQELDGVTDPQTGAPIEFSAEARARLAPWIAAQLLLRQELAELNIEDPVDSQKLYELMAPMWDQVCIAAAQFPPTSIDAAEEVRTGGGGVEAVAERVAQDIPEELADQAPGVLEECVSELDLPQQLVQELDRQRIGSTSRVIALSDATGVSSGVVVRLDDRRVLPLQEALPTIQAVLAQVGEVGFSALVSAQVRAAEINPQYGSGVDATGVVVPPEAPVRPIGESVALPGVVEEGVPGGGAPDGP